MSSAEVEYYASYEAAKEYAFVYNLIKCKRIDLHLPIILKAIYLANNYLNAVQEQSLLIQDHIVLERLF